VAQPASTGGTALHDVAQFAASLRFEDLPASTVRTLKHCMLDTLGCLVGGVDTYVAGRFLQLVESGPTSGSGPSFVAGSQATVPPELAALVNGTIAHALIFDDMHRTAKIHPGVFTLPAMLALNDALDVNGADAFVSIAVGYEVASRIGIAINMAEHRNRGWRATSTVGSIGAAAATARLLNLDADRFHHALAAGAAQASGTFAFAERGGMELFVAAGTAARNGVTAGLMARAGFSGAADPLQSHDGGLFTSTSADTDPDALLNQLGSVFRLEDVSLKLHPTCHSTQTAIDAALDLRAEFGLRIKDVERIVVEAGEITRVQCGWHYTPSPPEKMIFHMGFILASVLETGAVLASDLRGQLLNDPEYVRLATATEIVEVPELTAIYKTKKPCIVHLHLFDGRVLTKRVDFCRGDPENRPTDEELIAKFRGLTAEKFAVTVQDELIDRIMTVETQSSLRPVSRRLAEVRPSRQKTHSASVFSTNR
jgi:2-methylcitrate dehydratase PrpD